MKKIRLMLTVSLFILFCKCEKEIEVIEISIKTAPVKTEFLEGNKLSLAGLEITLKMSDGEIINVMQEDFLNSGITFSPSDGDIVSLSKTKITITHTASAKSTTLDISVVASEMVDIDGNAYKIVSIGNQFWMAENLKVTKYPDGTPIPNIKFIDTWESLDNNNIDDAYCYYNNNLGSVYGALYTWAAAMGDNANDNDSKTVVQGVCPSGWHLPSDEEWTELENFISEDGYEGIEGKALKSKSGWYGGGNDNYVGLDIYGFSALPSGNRGINGLFYGIREHCTWWSSTSNYSNNARTRQLYDTSNDFMYADQEHFRFAYKSCGLSIRCIRD